jgi:2-desacetyl-2-hydroxyethyl bacteriochlorophyllide A dehydrogenase
MRDYFTYPAKLLHPSAILSEDQLVLIEPLAIGCHAVDRARIVKEDIVLVIGAGPIGLATTLFAKLTGARIIAMDIDENKLKKCRNITGISETINASRDIVASLNEMLDRDLPTIVFDATGNPKSMMNTYNYIAAGGTIVFVGLFIGDVVFNDPDFHKKELTLKASRAALSSDFSKVIDLMESGKIDARPFITHKIKFDELSGEFEKLYTYGGDMIKALIEMD